MADLEPFEPHRQTGFEHLGIGETRIGHMGLHRRTAPEAGTGASAAADRFVVLNPLVAKGQVVHRALGPCHRPQSRQQGVGQGLGDLDVAGDNRGRWIGVEQ